MPDLETMKNMPVMELIRDELVDIATVAVGGDFKDIGRIAEYVRQVKNPYGFIAGKYVIKARHDDRGPTFAECMRGVLL